MSSIMLEILLDIGYRILAAVTILLVILCMLAMRKYSRMANDRKAGWLFFFHLKYFRAILMYGDLSEVRSGQMSYERFLENYNAIRGKDYERERGTSQFEYAKDRRRTAIFREIANKRRDLVEKYMMGPQFRYDVEFKGLMHEFNTSVPADAIPVLSDNQNVEGLPNGTQPAPIVQNITVNNTTVNKTENNVLIADVQNTENTTTVNNTENNVLLADIQNTQNNIDNRISVQNVTNLPPAEVKEKKYEVPGSAKVQYNSFKELKTKNAPKGLDDNMRIYFSQHKRGKDIGITLSFLEEIGYIHMIDLKAYVAIIQRDFGVTLGYKAISEGTRKFDRHYPSEDDTEIIQSLSNILNVKMDFFLD